MNMIRRALIFGAVVSGLPGCASAPPASVQAAPVIDHSGSASTADETAPLTPLPAATQPAAPPPANPAVVALLDQAAAQGRSGHVDQAAAALERALRIQPDNGWLWHRLAAVRLQQQRYSETVELATKSNALARGDTKLIQANQDLIAKAKAALSTQPSRG